MFHLWPCSCACNNGLLQALFIVGDERYTTALDNDNKEISALFQEVLLDTTAKYKDTIRSLRDEQAKGFMQELQEVRFHLRLAINTARRYNCRHSKGVLHCCKKTDFSMPLNGSL